HLDTGAVPRRDLVDRGQAEPEAEAGPEAPAVEPERLADELADRTRLRRERLRLRRGVHAKADTSRGTAARNASSAASNCQRLRSGSAGSFETARTSTAGTPASCAARSTANPSIASTRQDVPPPTFALVPMGSASASGRAARARASSPASG